MLSSSCCLFSDRQAFAANHESLESGGLSRSLFGTLYKCEQIGIDLVRVGCGHPMRKAWIHLKRRTLHKLYGLQGRRGDRHDLVVITVKNERWHVELLEVFGEIRLRKSLDAVVACLHPAHHALEPPLIPDAFRYLGARPVVAVKGKSNVPVELRPIFRI